MDLWKYMKISPAGDKKTENSINVTFPDKQSYNVYSYYNRIENLTSPIIYYHRALDMIFLTHTIM